MAAVGPPHDWHPTSTLPLTLATPDLAPVTLFGPAGPSVSCGGIRVPGVWWGVAGVAKEAH